MEDNSTRRQITWILIIVAALALIIYAGQQRNLVPNALERLASGDLSTQVAAMQTLVDSGKVAEALKEQPRWVQMAAVKALLEMGTPEAIQQLAETVPLLDDPVGKWATEALASFGRLAIGPLVECMQNKDGGVRAAAQGPLIKIGGTPEGGQAVIAAMSPFMGAYDDFVRGGVTAVLSALGDPAAPVAVKMLLRTVPDQGMTSAAFTRAQDCAVEILVAMKEPALAPIIKDLVPNQREKVRATAALMLGRMAAPLGPKGTQVVPPLLQLLGDTSWSVRRRAALGLGELGKLGQTQPEVLTALTAHLQDNVEVKAGAVKSLGMIAAPGSAPALVQTLISNREGAAQELVLALQTIGPAALSAMGPALNASDAEARELATQAVAGMNAKEGAPLLAARLGDAADTVRRVAARALEAQATTAELDALSRALGDSDPVVYGAVQRAFTRLGAAAVPALIARLGSGDPRVALVATSALTSVGPPAVGPLAASLRSSNAFTRDWAAVALGELGRPALPDTAAVLAEAGAPETARMAAANALGRSQLPEAVAPLTAAASGGTATLRQAVLKGLADTRQPAATSGLVAGVSDPDAAVSMTAMRLLLDWQLADTDKQLSSVVASGSEEAKRRAAVALAFHESPGSTPLLGALFTGAAATAAEQSTELGPILNRAVTDPAESADMHRLGIIALAYRGDSDSVELLNSYLTPGAPLAPTAARALGILGGRLAKQGGAGDTAAQAAVQKLSTVLTGTQDDNLRLQVATALSLMQGAPVPKLIELLNGQDETLKPWVTAIMGAIGKPANEESMRERGRDQTSKPWVTVSIYLIGDPESVKFLQRLPQAERAEPARIEAAQVVYDQIMKVRATPFA